MKQIYMADRLPKRIDSMKKEGKKAAIAAEKALRFISMASGGGRICTPRNPETVLNPTRHGELRIKNCIKFDLGGGYRMISIKEKARLYLLYIGSHDECHRWIENNREIDMETIRHRSQRVVCRIQDTPSEHESLSAHQKPPDDSANHDDEIDDKSLRVVFSGLINGLS